MALKEYEVDGQTFLFDEEDPLLPKHAKLVADAELSEVPGPVFDEVVQDEPETPVETPDDADPAPVEDSHPVKRGRRASNKAAAPEADKAAEATFTSAGH